jgi:hypothetical protein
MDSMMVAARLGKNFGGVTLTQLFQVKTRTKHRARAGKDSCANLIVAGQFIKAANYVFA